MNKQLLDAYDQINLTISDLEVYAYNKDYSSGGTALASLLACMELKTDVEKLMKLEGMKIPGEDCD